MVASKQGNWKTEGTKALVWFHRWLGVVTCIILAMWFASGAVLVFQPFPSLSQSARLEGAAPVQLASVLISPAEAAAKAGSDIVSVRLLQRAGVPAYLVQSGAQTVAIGAQDGNILPPIARADAEAIGRVYLNRVPATVHGPIEYDQWIVDNGFDSSRPFYRVDAEDEAGTQVYVSARTGEAAQQTTATERMWTWLGAVLHWVYFTPLRASFSAWDKVVWSLSLLTTLVAVTGITLGLIRTFAVRRAGLKGLTFFRLKWFKYHHILGLFAGVFVIGWAASGWLSMDHGRLFPRGQPSASELGAFQGKPIIDVLSQIDISALRGIAPAKEVRIVVVNDEALLSVLDAGGHAVMFDTHGAPVSAASLDGRVRRAIARGWPKMQLTGAEDVAPTDFYAVAEGMPGKVRRYELQGAKPLSLYVDMTTGSIVTAMDGSRATYSWLYYALHTFKVPGLISRPLLREILVLALLGVGFVFSVTGMVLGVQRLRKAF